MKIRMSLTAAVVALVLGVSAFAQSKGKIEGVWSLTEVTTTGANGSTKQTSQPSLYLFTKNHYSIIYVSSDAPRPETDSDQMSAEELRNNFVNSFIANAGTYEFKDGKLTMHPMVAKAPSFMKQGTWVKQSVKMDANTLTLVSESSNTGPSTNPTTFKLKRVE